MNIDIKVFCVPTFTLRTSIKDTLIGLIIFVALGLHKSEYT